MRNFLMFLLVVAIAACTKNGADRPDKLKDGAFTLCSDQAVSGLWLVTAPGPNTLWFFQSGAMNIAVRYESPSEAAAMPTKAQVIDLWQKVFKNDPSIRQSSEVFLGFAEPVRTYTDTLGNKLNILSFRSGTMGTLMGLPPELDLPGQTALELKADNKTSDMFLCNISHYGSVDRSYLVFSGLRERNAKYHMRRIEQ